MNWFSFIRKSINSAGYTNISGLSSNSRCICSCNKYSSGMDFHQKPDILQQCVGLGDISWTKGPSNMK